MKLNDLPRDVLPVILNKLDRASDIIAATSTCKALRETDVSDAWSAAYQAHPWTIRAPKMIGPHSYRELFARRIKSERQAYKDKRAEIRSITWSQANYAAQRGMGPRGHMIAAQEIQPGLLAQEARRLSKLEREIQVFERNFAKARLQIEPTLLQKLSIGFKRLFSA